MIILHGEPNDLCGSHLIFTELQNNYFNALKLLVFDFHEVRLVLTCDYYAWM